jgi:FMN phosphatase YigB (HAD superfamily)
MRERQLGSIVDALRSCNTAGKKKIAVVDVDGTLVLTEDAQNAADIEVFGRALEHGEFRRLPRLERGKVHDLVATKYRRLLRPNTLLVDRLNNSKEDTIVAVLTGRWKNVEEDTRKTLDEIKLQYDALITNPNGKETSDEVFKLWVLSEIAKMFELIEVYEDKEENIAYFMKNLKQQANERYAFFIVVKKDGEVLTHPCI